MSARNYLRMIIDTATDLLEHADSGGNRELAFDLMADEDELKNAFDVLDQHDYRIAEEMANPS